MFWRAVGIAGMLLCIACDRHQEQKTPVEEATLETTADPAASTQVAPPPEAPAAPSALDGFYARRDAIAAERDVIAAALMSGTAKFTPAEATAWIRRIRAAIGDLKVLDADFLAAGTKDSPTGSFLRSTGELRVSLERLLDHPRLRPEAPPPAAAPPAITVETVPAPPPAGALPREQAPPLPPIAPPPLPCPASALKGKITDPQGKPIRGAFVFISGIDAGGEILRFEAGADGTFESDPDLTAREYDVDARAAGYRAAKKRVARCQGADIPFALEPTAEKTAEQEKVDYAALVRQAHAVPCAATRLKVRIVDYPNLARKGDLLALIYVNPDGTPIQDQSWAGGVTHDGKTTDIELSGSGGLSPGIFAVFLDEGIQENAPELIAALRVDACTGVKRANPFHMKIFDPIGNPRIEFTEIKPPPPPPSPMRPSANAERMRQEQATQNYLSESKRKNDCAKRVRLQIYTKMNGGKMARANSSIKVWHIASNRTIPLTTDGYGQADAFDVSTYAPNSELRVLTDDNRLIGSLKVPVCSQWYDQERQMEFTAP